MFSAGSRSSSSYTSSDSDSTDTKNTVNRKLSYVSVESIPDTLVEVHVYREAYNRPRPTPVAEKPFSPNPSAVLACATDDRQRLDRSELERKRQREEEARKAKENELPPLPPPSRPTSGTEKKVAEETSLPSISEEETEVKQPLDVVNNEGLQSIETVEPKQPLADCGVDEPLPHLEQTSEFTDQRRQSQVRTPHEHILSPPLSESSSSSASACSDKETQWNSSSGVRPVKKPYSDKKKVSKDKLEELDTIWKDRGEREKCIQVGPNAVSVAKHLPPPVFGVSKEARAAPSRVRKEAASKKEKVKPSIERGSENGDGSDGDFSSSYSYSSWSTYSRSPSVPDTEDEPRAKYTETGVDPICLDDELRVETMLESLEEEILINNSDTSKNNSVSKSGGESQGGGSQSTVPKKASEAKRRTKSRHRHHHHHHPQRQSSVHGRGTGAREGATKLPPISKAGRSSKNRERAEEEQAARRHHHSHHHVKERKDKPLHKAGTSASKTEPSRDRKAKPSSSQTVPKLKQSAMEEYDGSHYWTAHSPYMQRVFPHSESSAENTSGHGGTQEGGRTNRRDGNVNGKAAGDDNGLTAVCGIAEGGECEAAQQSTHSSYSYSTWSSYSVVEEVLGEEEFNKRMMDKGVAPITEADQEGAKDRNASNLAADQGKMRDKEQDGKQGVDADRRRRRHRRTGPRRDSKRRSPRGRRVNSGNEAEEVPINSPTERTQSRGGGRTGSGGRCRSRRGQRHLSRRKNYIEKETSQEDSSNKNKAYQDKNSFLPSSSRFHPCQYRRPSVPKSGKQSRAAEIREEEVINLQMRLFGDSPYLQPLFRKTEDNQPNSSPNDERSGKSRGKSVKENSRRREYYEPRGGVSASYRERQSEDGTQKHDYLFERQGFYGEEKDS